MREKPFSSRKITGSQYLDIICPVDASHVCQSHDKRSEGRKFHPSSGVHPLPHHFLPLSLYPTPLCLLPVILQILQDFCERPRRSTITTSYRRLLTTQNIRRTDALKSVGNMYEAEVSAPKELCACDAWLLIGFSSCGIQEDTVCLRRTSFS